MASVSHRWKTVGYFREVPDGTGEDYAGGEACMLFMQSLLRRLGLGFAALSRMRDGYNGVLVAGVGWVSCCGLRQPAPQRHGSGLDPVGAVGPFDAFAVLDELAGHADAPAFAFDDPEGVRADELSGGEGAGFVDEEQDGALLEDGAGMAGEAPTAREGARTGFGGLGLEGEGFGGEEGARGEGDGLEGGATGLIIHNVMAS